MTAVLLFLVQLPVYSATADSDLTNIVCTVDAQYSVMEIDGTGNNSGARYQCFFNRSESSDGLTTTMVADIYRDGVERTQVKMILNQSGTYPTATVVLNDLRSKETVAVDIDASNLQQVTYPVTGSYIDSSSRINPPTIVDFSDSFDRQRGTFSQGNAMHWFQQLDSSSLRLFNTNSVRTTVQAVVDSQQATVMS